MQFFMNAMITKSPPGNRRFEGEKRCIMNMSGANTGKFGQKDEVRTVGMATAPKLKRRRARYLLVTNRLTGQIFTRVAAVCN
jgi:hypothetical protein